MGTDDLTAQVNEALVGIALTGPQDAILDLDMVESLAERYAPRIAASWRAVASVAYPSCGCEPCKKAVEHLAAAGLPKLRGET